MPDTPYHSETTLLHTFKMTFSCSPPATASWRGRVVVCTTAMLKAHTQYASAGHLFPQP